MAMVESGPSGAGLEKNKEPRIILVLEGYGTRFFYNISEQMLRNLIEVFENYPDREVVLHTDKAGYTVVTIQTKVGE
jgi:hypothetical protein